MPIFAAASIMVVPDGTVTGIPSILMVTILFFSGVQLISVGVIGEYLSRIFVETKARPAYIIKEKINCD